MFYASVLMCMMLASGSTDACEEIAMAPTGQGGWPAHRIGECWTVAHHMEILLRAKIANNELSDQVVIEGAQCVPVVGTDQGSGT